MKDYSKTLATAKRIVRDKGRQITLVKFSPTPPSPSQPWLGPTNPSATSSEVSVYAVGVHPTLLSYLGFNATQVDLAKNMKEVFVVEPGETDPENLDKYNVLRDGGIDYKISSMEKLRPGTLTLLYFIGVER